MTPPATLIGVYKPRREDQQNRGGPIQEGVQSRGGSYITSLSGASRVIRKEMTGDDGQYIAGRAVDTLDKA